MPAPRRSAKHDGVDPANNRSELFPKVRAKASRSSVNGVGFGAQVLAGITTISYILGRFGQEKRTYFLS
jgi:hypothetical protein